MNQFSFILHPSAFILSFIAVLLSSSFFGCGRGHSDAVVKPAEEHLRVGAFMSLTGDTAQYGISALNGIRMAVEEANAAGGVKGHRIDLIVRDTRSAGAAT